MTSIEDTNHFMEKAVAYEERILADYVVNRTWRQMLAESAFWLIYPSHYPIKLDVIYTLEKLIRARIGIDRFNENRKRGLFVLLAVAIDNNKQNFEWVMTQLGILGFSPTTYPKR